MKKIALVFPGQGSQYPGMGKALFENFRIAKEIYEEASDVLSIDMRKLSFETEEDELKLTFNAQPAILTHSIAALKILDLESNILDNKNFLITAGHSLGEYSSLTAAEALKFSTAVMAVRKRGEFMNNTCEPGFGTMAAIMGSNIEDITTICESISKENHIVVPANMNSEKQTVISGHTKAVEDASTELKEKGAKVFPLTVSAAFHSPLMNKAAEQLKTHLDSIEINSLTFPYVANHDAHLYDKTEKPDVLKNNLVQQVVSPVRWLQSMDVIRQESIDQIIELGPGKVICGLFKKFDRSIPQCHIDTVDDLKAFLSSQEA